MKCYPISSTFLFVWHYWICDWSCLLCVARSKHDNHGEVVNQVFRWPQQTLYSRDDQIWDKYHFYLWCVHASVPKTMTTQLTSHLRPRRMLEEGHHHFHLVMWLLRGCHGICRTNVCHQLVWLAYNTWKPLYIDQKSKILYETDGVRD